MIEIRDNGPEARTLIEQADRSVVRSVYLPLMRGVTPRALDAFDPVTQTLVTGERDATTVPTQALYLLNGSFVRRQSLSMAERLLPEYGTPANRVRQAYRLTLGRSPTQEETQRALAFIGAYRATYAAQNAATLATFSPPHREKNPEPVQPAVPADPDDVDRTDYVPEEEAVQPANADVAAWMSFVQALYASAEFRFVR